jgi:hypothetical protein
MSFIRKCFKTVLIIAALLFVTFASKYVSFFFSDLFGADLFGALGGAIAGALFLGLAAAKGFSSFRKIWFLKKNTFNQDLNEITQNESDLRIKYEHDNKFQQGSSNVYSNNPEIKACPFCAEEVKYAAIKCKHCFSDISERKSL